MPIISLFSVIGPFLIITLNILALLVKIVIFRVFHHMCLRSCSVIISVPKTSGMWKTSLLLVHIKPPIYIWCTRSILRRRCYIFPLGISYIQSVVCYWRLHCKIHLSTLWFLMICCLSFSIKIFSSLLLIFSIESFIVFIWSSLYVFSVIWHCMCTPAVISSFVLMRNAILCPLVLNSSKIVVF